MDIYFAKLSTSKPIGRGSWPFELDQPLYLGPGEAHASMENMSMDEAASRIHLQVDWQTLRRLPLSGQIAFNFKALFTLLEQLRREPYIPSLALKVLKEGTRDVLKYKGTHRTEEVVIPVSERFRRKQADEGLAPLG
jgi:hypothetical protein